MWSPSSNPTVLVDLPCDTGEGPLWDDATNTLLWCDIPAGTLFRYHPSAQTNHLEFQHDGSIGGFTLQADGSMLLFGDEGRIVRLRDGEIDTIVESIDGMDGSRFNDVSAAPDGSVMCGTMPWDDGRARLYRLDRSGALHLVCDDVSLSNGIDFSPDNTIMYLSDSDDRRIFAFDFDAQSGAATNRRVLINHAGEDFVPDGLAVDAEGDLWIARWDGRGLARHAPTGEQIGFIEFPVRKVSSVAFGGDGLRTAYVTTAGGQDRKSEGARAGSLFCADLGVAGRTPFRSRILQ